MLVVAMEALWPTVTRPVASPNVCLDSHMSSWLYMWVPAVATLDVMEVLGAPSRREIVDLLRDGALPVNALVARLDLTQPAVSKHLRVLREAGLVRVQADGRRRLYALRPEPLMELAEWLEPYREMWRESLDRLARHLDGATPPHNPTVPGTPTPSDPTVTRKQRS